MLNIFYEYVISLIYALTLIPRSLKFDLDIFSSLMARTRSIYSIYYRIFSHLPHCCGWYYIVQTVWSKYVTSDVRVKMTSKVTRGGNLVPEIHLSCDFWVIMIQKSAVTYLNIYSNVVNAKRKFIWLSYSEKE